MQEFKLLSLRLHAPLPFEGVENPPFRGLDAGSASGLMDGIPQAGRSEAEGREEIFVFDAEELTSYDADEGPRAAESLPAPSFHGRSVARGQAPGDAVLRDAVLRDGALPYSLSPGVYLFMQWRPANDDELREGIEWFAREAWWEGEKPCGPYIIRRLVEDGKVATQIFRALGPERPGQDA
jgi:hypothetical protein